MRRRQLVLKQSNCCSSSTHQTLALLLHAFTLFDFVHSSCCVPMCAHACRFTLARLVRGIATGSVRKHLEAKEAQLAEVGARGLLRQHAAGRQEHGSPRS
jgi:hypothetical protein